MIRTYFLISIVLCWIPRQVHAYANFIGYGYGSCLTCHWNGAGGGVLSQYGRGLFAAEIAAKPFTSPNLTDDELSARSGFLGKVERTPWWILPSVKYRGLWQETRPGSKQTATNYYAMQRNVGATFFLREDQTLSVLFNLGYIDNFSQIQPNAGMTGDHWFMQDYGVRWQVSEPAWITVGFLDKPYGIRHADHTAFNRSTINLGQNDQVHGVQYHFYKQPHEYIVAAYLGNLHVGESARAQGVSGLYEYEINEKTRFGGSLLYETYTNNNNNLRAALIAKKGIGAGHSLIAELGRYENKMASGNSSGYYFWSEGLIKLLRGYNLLTQFQMQYPDSNISNQQQVRMGIGLLLFPFQRLELRSSLLRYQTLGDPPGSEENWYFQNQVHMSF